MNRILIALSFVGLAFATTGCSKDPAEQAVGLMEEMATIADSNKEDCDKMGDALKGFMDKNGETLKKLKESDKGKSEEEKKAMMEKYKDRLGAAMGKMMPAMTKCATNEKVKGAMSNM
ncbi:MAG: hypothetical protein KC549_14900 [Myxococcales bacterium]|nr:hypothetical protein [Myxococcales bacterium]MCB9545416.1 hypothetical protein [Myxococcales bacterium]